MNVTEFIWKWRGARLSERSAAQQHFLDLCELLDHPKPADVDSTAETFTFEKLTQKRHGSHGWADVWKRGAFAWEYKGKHRDLEAAYDQLLEYREALENPPLLVVCDIERIVVHTNFTATPHEVHEVKLRDIGAPRSLEILRAVFHDPEKLRPGRTSRAITTDAAERIANIAQSMRDRGLDAHDVAHFLNRIVFCLFAEDIELLPKGLFTRLLEMTRRDPEAFRRRVRLLFDAMAEGGDFGVDTIRHFNGSLFVKGLVLELTRDEIDSVHKAAQLDWGAVDPSIFGTLFERGMDPDKRSQIGAHYTSREDIETLVDPVVMWPLRREWDETKGIVENLLSTGRKSGKKPDKPLSKAVRTRSRNESKQLVNRFYSKLTQIKVLDPACGSGNFLYVTLQKLKDLEKEIIVFAHEKGLGQVLPMVGPWQLYGIEISPYAYDLAQMVVWIGYLQWIKANGFGIRSEPILKPMEQNFQNKDAILDMSDPDNPTEPEWPKVDYIVGNPPFLGDKLMRHALGDDYVEALRSFYDDRIPGQSDLCCYWFEKAREHIEHSKCDRAGLLATQGIRGKQNRRVLERIKRSGDIFFAVSDRPWILDGASVHVALIGFDDGAEKARIVDGKHVSDIHSNLAGYHMDVTEAKKLPGQSQLAFIGTTKKARLDIQGNLALEMLRLPNPSGLPNSDVILPYLNGRDVTQGNRGYFIIDFPPSITKEKAARYEAPFEYVKREVLPGRRDHREKVQREYWWRLARPCPELMAAISSTERVCVSPRVAKHRLFVWIKPPILPDCQLIVFARSDDYFFGVLHSRLHEVWARALGTQLRERESGFRYNPTTCFQTFAFPWAPGEEPDGDPAVAAIAAAARELNELRENWLNPAEYTVTEVLEFPGSVDGPWARYVEEPDERGIGAVRYPRTVADAPFADALKKRTLTNLYNEMPTWLENAHRKLDEAVFAAYRAATGDSRWSPEMTDEEILESLLKLNLERA